MIRLIIKYSNEKNIILNITNKIKFGKFTFLCIIKLINTEKMNCLTMNYLQNSDKGEGLIKIKININMI